MTAFEEEIDSAVEQNDLARVRLVASEQASGDGIDDALDQINRFQFIASKLKTLNDVTVREFNRDSDATYKVLPSMKVLLRACNNNLEVLNASRFRKALASTIDFFQTETDRLEENIDDFTLIKETIDKDDEWESILNQL